MTETKHNLQVICLKLRDGEQHYGFFQGHNKSGKVLIEDLLEERQEFPRATVAEMQAVKNCNWEWCSIQ